MCVHPCCVRVCLAFCFYGFFKNGSELFRENFLCIIRGRLWLGLGVVPAIFLTLRVMNLLHQLFSSIPCLFRGFVAERCWSWSLSHRCPVEWAQVIGVYFGRFLALTHWGCFKRASWEAYSVSLGSAMFSLCHTRRIEGFGPALLCGTFMYSANWSSRLLGTTLCSEHLLGFLRTFSVKRHRIIWTLLSLRNFKQV